MWEASWAAIGVSTCAGRQVDKQALLEKSSFQDRMIERYEFGRGMLESRGMSTTQNGCSGKYLLDGLSTKALNVLNRN